MRTKIFTLLIPLLWICFSCRVKPGAPEENMETKLADSLFKQKNKTSIIRSVPEKVEIKPNSIIRIVSTKYELNDSKSDDMLVSKCKEWNLSEKSIISIFRHGKPISMHDFHYLYYVLPCEVKGSVQIDGNIYKYRINAGSFFTISTGDSTYYFECASSQCSEFFLMGPGDSKMDLEP